MTEIYYILRDRNSRDKELFWINEKQFLCISTNNSLNDNDIKHLVKISLPNLIGFAYEMLPDANMTVVDFVGDRLWKVPQRALEWDDKMEKKLKLCIIDVQNGPDTIKTFWFFSKEEEDFGLSVIRETKVHGSLIFEDGGKPPSETEGGDESPPETEGGGSSPPETGG